MTRRSPPRSLIRDPRSQRVLHPSLAAGDGLRRKLEAGESPSLTEIASPDDADDANREGPAEPPDGRHAPEPDDGRVQSKATDY